MSKLDLWRQNSWNPFKEIMSLQRAMDRMTDDVMTFPKAQAFSFDPPCDISETESHYLVTAELPGVLKEDIKIELSDQQLIIAGEKMQERKDSKKHMTERFYGQFERRFSLPTPVDADKVEADYHEGVLRIAIPKSAYSQARQIKVADKSSGTLSKFFTKTTEKQQGSDKSN